MVYWILYLAHHIRGKSNAKLRAMARFIILPLALINIIKPLWWLEPEYMLYPLSLLHQAWGPTNDCKIAFYFPRLDLWMIFKGLEILNSSYVLDPLSLFDGLNARSDIPWNIICSSPCRTPCVNFPSIQMPLVPHAFKTYRCKVNLDCL